MYYTGSVPLAQDNRRPLPKNPPDQQVYSHERYHNIISHHMLLKHTDIIPSLSTSVWVVVVVVELRAHTTETRFAHASRTSWAQASRGGEPCGDGGTSHVWRVRRVLNGLTVVDLGHSTHTSTSQSRILVAVSPAVNRSLDQSSLPAETGVEFG